MDGRITPNRLTTALATAVLASCTSNVGPLDELPRNLTPAEQTVVSEANAFGLDLFGRLAADDREGNVFLSPLSAYMALGMVANGASGETLEGIRATLHQSGLDEAQANEAYRGLLDLLLTLDPKVDLEIANAIWYRLGLHVRSTFEEQSQRTFDAAVEGLDFADPASVDVINGWVRDRTRNRIDEIVSELPPELVMLLVNAVYFKGSWQTEFDVDRTHDAGFTLLDETVVNVPMMLRPDVEMLRYQRGDAFEAAELLYGNGAFVMTVIVPSGGAAPADLMASLDASTWDGWMNDFEEVASFGQVLLPKFRIEWEEVLNDQLAAMGMSRAFSTSADLSRLFDEDQDLMISRVKQKSFVDVNEEGTEAAAVTSVGVGVTSAPPGFRVDRPFVFAIRERFSGTVLFIGQVLDPRG